MYKFKKALITLIGMVSLVTIATITLPHLSYGFSGPTASAPTSQTQNVNVVNTPTVKIDNSIPLVMRDVDNPVRQSFEASSDVLIQAGQHDGSLSIVTVPAGKTLVVEYISLSTGLTNQRLVSASIQWRLGEQQGGGPHFVTLTDQGADFFGQEVFVASQSTRLYFREGSNVVLRVERNTTAGPASVFMSLSGYLVNN